MGYILNQFIEVNILPCTQTKRLVLSYMHIDQSIHNFKSAYSTGNLNREG